MKVKMLNNKIAIEVSGKMKKQENSFLSMPDSTDSTGIVKFLSEDYEGPLKTGMRVCYGDKRNRVKMLGMELEVMSPDNVFAVLQED